MAGGSVGVWTLRIVRPDTHEPAAGVPVTLLNDDGNPAGYWVSDADGMVLIPRSATPRVRLRVGLRNEEPTILDAHILSRGITELQAPRSLLVVGTAGPVERTLAPRARVPVPVPAERELSTQILRFHRLGVIPPQPAAPARGQATAFQSGAGESALKSTGSPVDFFSVPDNYPAPLRYGVLVEVEQHWQSLGYQWGELLYTVTLAPGDEARVAVLDGRWRAPNGGPSKPGAGPREEMLPRERPLQILARMIAASAPLAPRVADQAPLPVEPFVLSLHAPAGGEWSLGQAAAETATFLGDLAVRMCNALRSRPLRLVEVQGQAPGAAALRSVRNTLTDRVVAFHFFEPLESYRVFIRGARLRPAILVPFRLPNLTTREVVWRFSQIIRRALLDPTLEPELDWLLGLTTGQSLQVENTRAAPPVSELRVVVELAPRAPALDLSRTWCFLQADHAKYPVHFYPVSRPPATGATAPSRPMQWVGAIHPGEFQHQPLRYPGRLWLLNGSRTAQAFKKLHLEGRVGTSWQRLLTLNDFVLPAQSHAPVTSLAALAARPGTLAPKSRLLAHIGANLAHYSAAIIAGGDPALRYLALKKVRDAAGYPIADIVENTVVGVVGNYLGFRLRSVEYAPAALQTAFAQYAARPAQVYDEVAVNLPIPGVWMSTQVAASLSGIWIGESAMGAEPETGEAGRDRPAPRAGRAGLGAPPDYPRSRPARPASSAV